MADNLYRVTLGGTLGATEDEIFSYGFWVADDGGGTSQADIATAWTSYVADFHAKSVSGVFAITTLEAAFPTWVHYKTLTARQVTPGTGIPLLSSGSIVDQSGNDGGGTAANGLPFQTGLAVTLRKAGRGRKIYNRFFLPPMVVGATTGEGIVEPGIPDAIGAFLAAEQAAMIAASPSSRLVHYSITDHTVSELVDSFTGSVIDTQRRRRNRVPELRTTVAL